jgi:hypothetical protein
MISGLVFQKSKILVLVLVSVIKYDLVSGNPYWNQQLTAG